MHFGEYELSPSLISLSPPPSVHPEAFQRLSVRSSSLCYQTFNLLMGRSHGFGSMATNFIRPVQTRFPYASNTECLKLASDYNSPDRSTKSTLPPFNGL